MPTPEQYREARRLLGWERAQLALVAATNSVMVMRLENGAGVTPQTRGNIKAALAAEGIVFGGDGTVQLVQRSLSVSAGTPGLQLTLDQVRLARRLLGWSQARLAHAANLGKSTASSSEVGDRVAPATRAAVMKALEAAGVSLDAEGRITLRRDRPPA